MRILLAALAGNELRRLALAPYMYVYSYSSVLSFCPWYRHNVSHLS